MTDKERAEGQAEGCSVNDGCFGASYRVCQTHGQNYDKCLELALQQKEEEIEIAKRIAVSENKLRLALTSELSQVRELVKHCWIHSGCSNCGYVQMTSEQKKLFSSLTTLPEGK